MQSVRETWFIRGQRTKTIPRCKSVREKWVNRESRTKGHYHLIQWMASSTTCITSTILSPGTATTLWKADKPFFCWINPSQVHVYTRFFKKNTGLVTPENGWTKQ